MARAVTVEHLTIDDLSDREFLLVLEDVADGDGYAESDVIAAQLNLAKRAIASSRLSWLARWGAVEREAERDEHGNIRTFRDGRTRYTQRWRLTDAGHALAHGALKTRQREALERIDEQQMLELTRYVTTRARSSSATAAKLISREWRYGTSAKRNGRL